MSQARPLGEGLRRKERGDALKSKPVAYHKNTRVNNGTTPRPPLVSVTIPSYNHAQFLGQAIESVLAQSYSNFELIVVDDGSTDNTAEVARHYSPVRYIYQENAGLSSARNSGLRQSCGEFLVFLDADDRLLPHALEAGINCMREHPECAFVSGHCRVIDLNGAILPTPRQRRVEHEHYLQLLRGGTYIWCPASVFYQRRIFDFVHGFDRELNPVADQDLYLRITRDFPVYSHNHVIVEYRQHSSNMSRDVSKMECAALAAHDAQWHFVKANSHYREAYDAGKSFWRNDYPFQQMVARIREIVREQLPPDAAIAVAAAGKTELLRLDGRRGWHFPQAAQGNAEELFAQGAEGSVATPAWIEAGMTYEFSLYKGTERSKLLARLPVKGVADPLPLTTTAVPHPRGHDDGVLLAAIPNPVPAAEEPGVTNITWSTGDGSEGQVYVSSTGVYAGHDPVNSDEAWASLESVKRKGAEYLIIPAQSFWWFDNYQKFRERVEAGYPTIVRDENTCIIFDLRESSK
jgi:glycosyltransferase involved in cell wall biosynthesis